MSQPPETSPPRAAVTAADDSDIEDTNAAAQLEQDMGPSYRLAPKFQTFRKHARDLYQSIATFETIWPCKTVQFMPYIRRVAQDCIEQTLVTGSSTYDQEQNYIKFLTLVQPANPTADLTSKGYDPEINGIGAFGMAPLACKFKIDLVMAHEGDVRRVRYIPHNPNVIVSSSSNDRVYVFDKSSIGRTQPPNKPSRPLLPLLPPKPDHSAPVERRKAYHAKKEDFARELRAQEQWDSKRHPGQHRLVLDTTDASEGDSGVTNGWALDASCAREGWVCLGGNQGLATWSLLELAKGCGPNVAPSHVYRDAPWINDAKWHPTQPDIIAAACGNCDESDSAARVALFDLREGRAVHDFAPPCGPIANSVDWSRLDDNIAAVGGSDGAAYLYDVRATGSYLARVACHTTDSEVAVAFCPHDDAIVGTAGGDGNSSLVRFQPDGEGQVLFVHTGHQDPVMEMAWAWHEDLAGQVVTVDDNAICAWKPRNHYWD